MRIKKERKDFTERKALVLMMIAEKSLDLTEQGCKIPIIQIDKVLKIKGKTLYRCLHSLENGGIPGSDPGKKRGRSLRTGDFYYAKKGQLLAAGDSLIPWTLSKVSFTTDVSASAQGQVFDVTTQADVQSGVRAFVASVFKDRSGTINGQVDVDSIEQRYLINEFNAVITDDGTYITYEPAKTGTHHFMLSRRETIEEGEVEAWEYFPVVIESFQTDKPIEGVCPFNFNYRVDGTHNPGIYYRTVTEGVLP